MEALFRAAGRAGRSTAAVYWPVTGLNAGIDDLIDEYFFPYYGETPEEAFAKLGAREAALEAVRENLCRFPYHFQKGLPLTRENTFDDFVNGCAAGPTCSCSTTAIWTASAIASACSPPRSGRAWT